MFVHHCHVLHLAENIKELLCSIQGAVVLTMSSIQKALLFLFVYCIIWFGFLWNGVDTNQMRVLIAEPIECDTIKPDTFIINHTLAWMIAAIIYKHPVMVWLFSLVDEGLEYFFAPSIPYFKECCWDKWFFDIFGANLVGVFLGSFFLTKWRSLRHHSPYARLFCIVSRCVIMLHDFLFLRSVFEIDSVRMPIYTFIHIMRTIVFGIAVSQATVHKWLWMCVIWILIAIDVRTSLLWGCYDLVDWGASFAITNDSLFALAWMGVLWIVICQV